MTRAAPAALASSASRLVLAFGCSGRRCAQEPSQPQAVSAEQLKAAIDSLGNLDYNTRTTASRTVRRRRARKPCPR